MKIEPINTKTWHYQLWKASYLVNSSNRPEQTTLCPYFWRIGLGAIMTVVLFAVLIALMLIATAVYGVISLARLMFGFSIMYPDIKDSTAPNIHHDLPRIPLGKSGMHPAWLMTPLTIGLFVWWHIDFFMIFVNVDLHPFLTLMGQAVPILIGLMVFIVAAITLFDSEFGWLVRRRYRAARDKVCPIITFVEDEPVGQDAE